MNNNEIGNKISSYIDSLNEELMPKEHRSNIENNEIEDILETVRLVKSLKKSNIPDNRFEERLNKELNNQLLKEKKLKVFRKWWLYGMASAAAAVVLIVTLNIATTFKKPNLVHAMEQAYSGVKAYHGTLEIIQTNDLGETFTQSKTEVWADKEGHYYVKGLEGAQKDLITANDGEEKWQIKTDKKEIDKFAAFPDTYRFTFEIGNEIQNVKNAVNTKIIGDDTVAGRAASVMEVSPQGGNSYKLWIDKETKMPLQKQASIEYSMKYKILYTNISFIEAVPKELLTYSVPNGYKEVNTNKELIVNSLEEAKALVGFMPKVPENTPVTFSQKSTAVLNNNKAVKLDYISADKQKNVLVMQEKAVGEFKLAAMANLGSINNNMAEVQSPIIGQAGVLQGGGIYNGVTGLSSVRWQQDGFEYAVVGNVSLDELNEFIEGLTHGTLKLPDNQQSFNKPEVEVPFDLKTEEAEQKSVDAGHSPWKLDPAFVTQVFVSLKISPKGITGDYPIKYEELKIVKNNRKEAIIEVNSAKSPVKRVYLKRLVRQDSTGIWTIVGYDPVNK